MFLVVERIRELFERHGNAAYLGEEVSQLEHALQAAVLAERDGAAPALVTAALLHDIGHLLDADAQDPARMNHDLVHEYLGAHWLAAHFGPEVTRPVELHVPAKRYLCATEPEYLEQLSPASCASLRLQGGPMSPREVETFLADPFAQDAVRLRRWDDQAKIVGLDLPTMEHFRNHLQAALR